MFEINNTNKVTATGILYKVGRGFRGYPEMGIMIGRKGMPKAFVKFVLETTLDPSIQVQTVVKVTGYVRGYQTRNENGRWVIDQYFVATKVERAVGEMEEVFGVPDHFKPRNEFRCYIKGRVNSALQTSKDWKSLIISIPGSREIPEIITVTIKDNVRYREYQVIQKGDEIVTRLDIWTPQKKINGELKSFEDLVVEDIYITNRDITKETTKEKVTAPGTDSEVTDGFVETEE